MKGIMGLQDVILNMQRVNKQEGSNNTKGIGFGQFMQRWTNQTGEVGQKAAIGKEERSLLEKSLVHLLNFKMLLNAEKDKTPSNENIKNLLQKMGGDPDFMNSLTPELRAMLQKLVKQLQEQGDLKKLDQKAVDELVQIWQMAQEKKRLKQMEEVDALIAAIEARLALAGIEVKAQVVSKGGEKTVKVSFSENGFARTNSEPEGQVVSKALLNKIASFLGEADQTTDKAEFSKMTMSLREELKGYLKREVQPVGWRKEELIHRAQYGALQELGTGVGDTEAKEATAAINVDHLLSEEVISDVELKVLAEGEETQIGVDVQEADILAELFSSADGINKEAKGLSEVVAREARLTYLTQPAELFEQMVEKFRMELKPGITQMEIKLYPEELGQLQLKLTVEKGIVTAQFVAETLRVKEVIEQNLATLKDTFAKQGIYWDQISVDVGQDGLQENPFAYQDGRQLKDQRQSNKGHNFSETMEELELAELDAEEERVKDPARLVDYRV